MATTTTAYTEEQTKRMLAVYDPTADEAERSERVEALAAEFGKSVKSIIAKLSREGVYVKKVPTRKDGTAIIKKDETADAIGKILGLSEPDTASLSKANRKALLAIFEALANSKPIS